MPPSASGRKPCSTIPSASSAIRSAAAASPAARACARVGGPAVRDLPVDPRLIPELEPQVRAARDDRVAERGPRAREQRGEGALGVHGRIRGPQGVDELVAAHRAMAVHGQVGDELAAAAPGQRGLEALAADLDGERAAHLETGAARDDPWSGRRRLRRRLRGVLTHDPERPGARP